MSARVFLMRHGETEWSLGGKHTSTTEVPLSQEGEEGVKKAREAFVGEGKLINPAKVLRVYCSPRQRARQTVELLNIGAHEHLTFKDRVSNQTTEVDTTGKPVQVTPWLEEWNYGAYEGLTIQQVHNMRREQGLDKDRNWSIWEDGCPGGESPQDVSDRLDQLIQEMKTVINSTVSTWPSGQRQSHAPSDPKDIVCVAHGHILAALALRWACQPLRNGTRLLMEPSGVAVLGFEHDDLSEPAIILGRKPGR